MAQSMQNTAFVRLGARLPTYNLVSHDMQKCSCIVMMLWLLVYTGHSVMERSYSTNISLTFVSRSDLSPRNANVDDRNCALQRESAAAASESCAILPQGRGSMAHGRQTAMAGGMEICG